MAESYLNPFPNKPWFLRVCSTSLLKILWEKEKLLLTSNFTFSHSVFYPFGELSAISIEFKIVVCKLFQFGSVKKISFGKGLKGRKQFWKRRNCPRSVFKRLVLQTRKNQGLFGKG